MIDQSNIFAGMNGFIWWVGVVENRKDPLNLCRCQIRIFGWHTDDKKMIPSEDLPWSQPLLPINNSNDSKTPLEGDWVVGFFLDSVAGQSPIYFGVMPGIAAPYVNNPQKGFTDPRTQSELDAAPREYQESPQRYPKYINEPSTSRLYRNEKIDTTIIGRRNSSLTKNIPASNGESWSEPASPYATVPPYNNVKETESGHVFEFDDTPTAERINVAHRTGTYFEMRPDGSKVTKVLGNNYEIVAGEDFVNITGTCNITIGGNANIKVNGNMNMDIGGTFNATAQAFNFVGPINDKGTITATTDVIAAGISLVGHTHADPQGGSVSPPQ